MRVFGKIVFIIAAIITAGILLYPVVSDWMNAHSQSAVIIGHLESVQNVDSEVLAELLGMAQVYNEDLRQDPDPFSFSDEEWDRYLRMLDSGDGIMGILSIEKIAVNLPIYHGTDEDALQAGIGHLPGSSLPVGGESTHAFITGHRGLPSSTLLSDLDQIVEGDRFVLYVAGQALTYQVDDIQTVTPDDMSAVFVTEGADYVTLLTCTPYGINTHRLLVRGSRVPDSEVEGDMRNALYADAKSANATTLLLLASIALAPLIALALFIGIRRSKGKERYVRS